jgi:Uma2 family endonuclease
MLLPMPQVRLGRPATYDDLVAVPDNFVAEIVDHELWTSPRPSPRHAIAAGELGAQLGWTFGSGGRGPGGWRILPEPELHIGPHVVAGWRLERMPDVPTTAWFPLAPDWICEIVSPSTVFLDRSKKLRVYAEAGVRHAWLVDPILRSLEVLRLEACWWTSLDLHVGDGLVRAAPFDAVALELGLLWAAEPPLPPTPDITSAFVS